MIISRTPFRISFFGGGTDYPAWFREHGGVVLSTTIDKYCYINCRFLPPFFNHLHRIVYSRIENVQEVSEIEHPAVRGVLSWMRWERGLEIHHDGDLPAYSGLGSSSSFTVGLINALNALLGRHVSKEDLATQAIHVEQEVIRENVGSQDQIAAAFGGFNKVEFRQDGKFKVMPVILPREREAELQRHLMLCFTGFSRYASDIAKSTIDSISTRRLELERMGQMVDEAMRILTKPQTPIEDFGRLLHDGWRMKRSLAPQVSTAAIDEIYETARSAGAIGGKIMGAGGGGFMLLFVPPALQQAVRSRLAKLIHVPFQFESDGSRIVLYQPNGL
jgi:D-glycero-alpha-D-manno-heptose-7-phosphate kinase